MWALFPPFPRRSRAEDHVLPFARIVDSAETYQVPLDDNGRPVALRGGGDRVSVPAGVIPLAVLRRSDSSQVLVDRGDLEGCLTVAAGAAQGA